MSTSPSSSSPTPSGGKSDLQPAQGGPVVPPFDERLWTFWQKNAKALLGLAALVLVVIVAQGAWEMLQEKKQRDIQQAYAAAAATAQLKAFASANEGHQLAGVAHLRMADEAYADRRHADAAAAYDQAASILKSGPLASRARLGSAMAKHQAGRTGEGETALKAIANDANEIKAYRAEAIAHLASLASAAGNGADVKAYADQLMQLDPTSPWTQRTLQLLASTPGAIETGASADADASPTISLPGKQ